MDSGEDIAEYALCIVKGKKLGLGGGPYLKYAPQSKPILTSIIQASKSMPEHSTKVLPTSFVNPFDAEKKMATVFPLEISPKKTQHTGLISDPFVDMQLCVQGLDMDSDGGITFPLTLGY